MAYKFYPKVLTDYFCSFRLKSATVEQYSDVVTFLGTILGFISGCHGWRTSVCTWQVKKNFECRPRSVNLVWNISRFLISTILEFHARFCQVNWFYTDCSFDCNTAGWDFIRIMLFFVVVNLNTDATKQQYLNQYLYGVLQLFTVCFMRLKRMHARVNTSAGTACQYWCLFTTDAVMVCRQLSVVI